MTLKQINRYPQGRREAADWSMKNKEEWAAFLSCDPQLLLLAHQLGRFIWQRHSIEQAMVTSVGLSRTEGPHKDGRGIDVGVRGWTYGAMTSTPAWINKHWPWPCKVCMHLRNCSSCEPIRPTAILEVPESLQDDYHPEFLAAPWVVVSKDATGPHVHLQSPMPILGDPRWRAIL